MLLLQSGALLSPHRIHAPEASDACARLSESTDEPYGKQAKWALVELCKGQEIMAYPTGETSYERIVAKCFLPDGRDLAAEMVKMELALDIPHFPNADYKHLETPAARKKLSWKRRKKKQSEKSK